MSSKHHDKYIVLDNEDVGYDSGESVQNCVRYNDSFAYSNNINNHDSLDYKDQIRESNRAQICLNEEGRVSNNYIDRNNMVGPNFKDQMTPARKTQRKLLTKNPKKFSEGENSIYNESDILCHVDTVDLNENVDVTDDQNVIANNLKKFQNSTGLPFKNANLDQVGAFYVAGSNASENTVAEITLVDDTAFDSTVVNMSTGGVDDNRREPLNDNESLHLVTAYEVTPDKSVIVAEPVKTNFVMRFVKERPYVAVCIIILIIGLLIVLITVVLVANNNNNNSSTASVSNSLPSAPPTSIPPTMAPTGSDFIRCFESGDELREAVVSYLNENNNRSVRDKYGENIGLWCVPKVQDFSNLFNKIATGDFQNPYGDVFNEDISHWNTSSATNMQTMFQYASLFNQDLSRWDVSSVKNMKGMFAFADSFNQNLFEWNTSSVKIMTGMFQYAEAFNGDISSWDTRSVKQMDFILLGASNFNGDLSAWNISSVNTLASMFTDAKSFNGDISTWDTSTVEYMDDMFLGASAFTGDLSKWNVGRVYDTSGMFAYALEFNSDISFWNMSKVFNSEAMFYNAAKFNQDISRWDVSSVKMMMMMFREAMSFNQDISRWNVSQVTDMNEMFFNTPLFNVSLCSWGLLLPENVNTTAMFGEAVGCPNTTIDPDMTSNPPGPFCHICP